MAPSCPSVALRRLLDVLWMLGSSYPAEPINRLWAALPWPARWCRHGRESMALRWLIRPNAYHDSVKLMRVSEELGRQPGVVRAAAIMATPLNVELLADDGLLPSGVRATPDDLLVVVLGEDEEAAEQALAGIDRLLAARQSSTDGSSTIQPRTLEQAAASAGANLAVIAVPGQYAAAEAFAALRAGLHVFLFSDNVPLEAEMRLKQLATELDLLMMGPDCGTAILDGLGLGFANRVQSGPAGIVGASGTGIQQVTCLLDRAGVGIAQAIGTGGRDLSAAVAASMTRRSLHMLEADGSVEVIGLISKPADEETARQLHQELMTLGKPVVACLLGTTPPNAGSVRYARTLTEAAQLLVEAVGKDAATLIEPAHDASHRSGKRVYGLFAGGTLCSEAVQILHEMDVPHHLVDLGADEYTRGRAHPIIDPRLRAGMLEALARRDDAGAVLLDVILGDLAHPDPAGTLVPALRQLRDRDMPVVVTLIGTQADPQGLEGQRAALEETGAQVFASNATAASVAGSMVRQ